MQNKMNVDRVYHVGVVVKDIEKKLETFKKYFNIDDSKIFTKNTIHTPSNDLTYYGQPVEFKVKVCIFPMANMEIEMIEPLDGKGPYADFLKNHGEGPHHFRIGVDDNSAFYTMMKELGATFLTSGVTTNGISYKYYDAKETLGLILELCEKVDN